jgi:hypothetical protein
MLTEKKLLFIFTFFDGCFCYIAFLNTISNNKDNLESGIEKYRKEMRFLDANCKSYKIS